MTTITSPHHHQDIQTDVRRDGRVDDRKDTEPVADGAAASAFVIVLANHLCRIRHRWFCAESRVMPRPASSGSGCPC
jgi:hypothetical protein